MHVYIHIMTKIISLSDDAYDVLKATKHEGESFSEVVRRITKGEKCILDFFGKWPGPKSELDRMKADVKRDRAAFKTREVMF